MGLFWTILQVFFMVTTCNGLRTLTKQATAFCVKSVDGTQFNMLFKLKRNNDPAGQLIPMIANTETKHSDGCAYSEANGLYQIDLMMDISTTASDVNKCGVVRAIEAATGKATYSWRIAFVEDKHVPTSTKIMLDDLDRIYNFACLESQLTETKVATHIDVSTPNLLKQIAPSEISVILTVKLSDGSSISPTSSVAAGTRIYLQLAMPIAANYRLGLDPSGIYAYNTEVAGTDQFNELLMFGNDGCVNTGTNRMPHRMQTKGFYRDSTQTTTSKWVLRTEVFYAYKFDISNQMVFRTNFWPCFGTITSTSRCVVSCLASPGRKRRDTTKPGEITTYITVEDGDSQFHIGRRDHKPSKQGSAAITTVIIIGIVVGVLVLLLISVIIVLLTCVKRRRRGEQATRNYNNFSNPPSVVAPTEKQ